MFGKLVRYISWWGCGLYIHHKATVALEKRLLDFETVALVDIFWMVLV